MTQRDGSPLRALCVMVGGCGLVRSDRPFDVGGTDGREQAGSDCHFDGGGAGGHGLAGSGIKRARRQHVGSTVVAGDMGVDGGSGGQIRLTALA